MKQVIDPLIAERAPWMFRGAPTTEIARFCVERLLGYRKTLDVAEAVKDLPTNRLMADLAQRLVRKLDVEGLQHIPRAGPALVVCNHPTGIADGIVVHHLLASRRPDLFIYANSDILRVLPQMRSLILPVEWRHDRRTHAKTRQTMALTERAVAANRMGVLFPSGRLAKRRGLRLQEREWMPSAALLVRKFRLPVVPLNIQARNSALFYLLDMIHPTLRDVTLFHETLNKHRQPFRVRIGAPILPHALPHKTRDAVKTLRAACLGLGDAAEPEVSMIRTTGWLQALS